MIPITIIYHFFPRNYINIHLLHLVGDVGPGILPGMLTGLAAELLATVGIDQQRMNPFGQCLRIASGDVEAIDSIFN